MYTTNNTIFYVAGRSGGHIVPALTLAARHKKKHPQDITSFIATNTLLDKNILRSASMIDNCYHMKLNNTPGRRIFAYPSFIYNLLRVCWQTYKLFLCTRPKHVVSTGGYIGIPITFVAYMLNIPVTLYELNAEPGRASKVIARFATTINCCFEHACSYFPKEKTRKAAYPIRFAPPRTPHKLPERFSASKKTVLILGGSQGSLFINKAIKEFVINNTDRDKLQVIHQFGAADKTNWKEFYARYQIPALTFTFTREIDYYYNIADIVVCRSGAGTLFETLFFEKLCLTIPLETRTTQHQVINAQALHKEYPEKVMVIMQDKYQQLFDHLSNALQK